MTAYLSAEEIVRIHFKVIKQYGGADGVHDIGLLESAVARPKAGFGEYEAYPDLFAKAAVLLHSLIKNHPFIDGNERTALTACSLFLTRNGYLLEAPEKNLFNFILSIANDKLDAQQITEWLKTHSILHKSTN